VRTAELTPKRGGIWRPNSTDKINLPTLRKIGSLQIRTII
jgi:hypothetical protein